MLTHGRPLEAPHSVFKQGQFGESTRISGLDLFPDCVQLFPAGVTALGDFGVTCLTEPHEIGRVVILAVEVDVMPLNVPLESAGVTLLHDSPSFTAYM